MNGWQFGYGLAGLLALAAVARWLRLGESRIASAAQARETAERMLAGFFAQDALVGTDGNAALVAGNGTVALLTRDGARVAARRLIAPLRLTQAVEGVQVEAVQVETGVLLFGVTDAQVRALEALSAVGGHGRSDVVVTLH